MADYSNIPLSAISLDAIRARAEMLGPFIVKTPCVAMQSPRIDAVLNGGSVHLKLECLQKTGTFKARGALSVALDITEENRGAGITAASAGNHAIAAAWAAKHIGVSAKVVMIDTANPFRIERTRALGAELIIIKGAAEAMAEAERLERDEGRTYIHPFEGPFTTLGAAGVGLEMVHQAPGLEVVIVAVGGGGLISGVAAAIKQANPDCKVFGVEPEGAASMQQSLAAGYPVALDGINTLADSLGAPAAKPFSTRVCQQFVDQIVTVSDDQICAGVVLFQEEAKLAVEPAAGAALAGALGPLRAQISGKKIGIVVCGANIDVENYAAVLTRGQAFVASLLR